MPKDTLTIKKKKKKGVGNRKRPGFVLTGQRDFWPITLGAAVAALVAHFALFWYAPELSFFSIKSQAMEAEVKDEPITINIKEPPKKEYEEEVVQPDETPVEKEIEDRVREPEQREIDILDYKLEELTLAPGETDLGFPEPVPGTDAPGEMTEMPTTELDASALQDVNVPEEALQVAEPTPVNASDVIVVADAQTQDLENANSLMDADLRKAAKEGDGQLPDDTRSLDQLMGISNLGKESGVARLGADLLFQFDQCRLTSSARFSMLQLAALIQKNPETDFVIEGHTDSIGEAEYNALLSLQRAAAVCEWLQKNRVPISRVHIRACGNKAPLANPKGSREAQSLNRRVEIHMRRKGEALPDGCFPASYAVDLDTPTRDQIRNGVRVPEVYTPSGTSIATDGAPKTTPRPATPAKPVPAAGNKGKHPVKPSSKPVKGKPANGKKSGKKK